MKNLMFKRIELLPESTLLIVDYALLTLFFLMTLYACARILTSVHLSKLMKLTIKFINKSALFIKRATDDPCEYERINKFLEKPVKYYGVGISYYLSLHMLILGVFLIYLLISQGQNFPLFQQLKVYFFISLCVIGSKIMLAQGNKLRLDPDL